MVKFARPPTDKGIDNPAGRSIKADMLRTILLLLGTYTLGLLAGCGNPASKQETQQVAPSQKTEVHTIGAEYYCENGKVSIRLIGTTGIKELDEVTLKLLIDISDSYPNLKEGQTQPYPADKLKELEASVTGK